MQLLLFLLVYPALWLISILPFRLLYAFSDGVYFVVYRIVGYRKKTVRHNLAIALPHLSNEERLQIEKKFYSHLCDMFLEMIKTMTISQAEMDKRFVIANLPDYLEMEKKGKNIALMCAHYATYEWVISMNKYITFEGYAIYKRVANRHFDKLVRDIRSRFKAHLITTKETGETILHNLHEHKRCIYGFASDQSPKAGKAHHWTKFMGIDTPVHTGAEMLAKKFDMNVIFLRVEKVKRGYYRAYIEELAENPKDFPNYEITDEFMKRVEKQIYAAPEYYLWTHKRWKHKRVNS